MCMAMAYCRQRVAPMGAHAVWPHSMSLQICVLPTHSPDLASEAMQPLKAEPDPCSSGSKTSAGWLVCRTSMSHSYHCTHLHVLQATHMWAVAATSGSVGIAAGPTSTSCLSSEGELRQLEGSTRCCR